MLCHAMPCQYGMCTSTVVVLDRVAAAIRVTAVGEHGLKPVMVALEDHKLDLGLLAVPQRLGGIATA